MENRETIAAVSTPSGIGGIGIIRLSGPRAWAIARRLFVPHRPASRPKTHNLYLGRILDPATHQSLDEVFLSYMAAPKTYTREDLVEINCHSGPLVLKKILNLVLSQGARLAEPGEFTLRAFLNGRIDLTQAEGVIELLQAQSDQALVQANKLLKGELKEELAAIQDELLSLLAQLEAAIDFPEEELEILNPQTWNQELTQAALQPLEILIQAYDDGRIFREGINLVIVGKPNVGKSSLLNRLLQEERAIVTAVPGTTRDTIEEPLTIQGIPFRLIDTAGIHRAREEVEQAGIARSRQKMTEAHLVLFLLDRSSPLDEKDLDLYEEIQDRPHLIVLNKMDLPAGLKEEELLRTFPLDRRLTLSARTGEGLEDLKNRVVEWFLRDHPLETTPALVPTLRQKIILEKTREILLEARREMSCRVSPEFIAVSVQEALNELGSLVGKATSEDVLEKVFSRFCIGK
jgi:tRNA modification GTPase